MSFQDFDLSETVQLEIHLAHQRTTCGRLFDCGQESMAVKSLAAQSHKKIARANETRIGDHLGHFLVVNSVDFPAHPRRNLFERFRIHAPTTPPDVPLKPGRRFQRHRTEWCDRGILGTSRVPSRRSKRCLWAEPSRSPVQSPLSDRLFFRSSYA